jgi:membrane-associated phospholipid phosphatase
MLRSALLLLPVTMAMDRVIAAALPQPSGVGKVLSQSVRMYGERWTPAVLAAVLYAGGWVAQQERWQRAGVAVAGAAAASAAVVVALKVALGRWRPDHAPDAMHWSPPAWEDAQQSFPSGHTAIAFAISAALDRTLELPPAWTAVLYGAAVMTGLSRMYDRRHWLSDVLAAAAIGYSFGQAVGSALHRELPPSGALQWEVLPGRASVRLALGR